jgi:hypothetical protein
VEGPQLPGPRTARYAVQPDHAPGALDPHVLADRVWNPLEVVDAPGGGDLHDEGSRLTLGGTSDGSVVVDAVTRDDEGRLLIRVHEPWGREATLAVPGRSGWLVDLRGRPSEPFRDEVAVAPYRIVTLRFDD